MRRSAAVFLALSLVMAMLAGCTGEKAAAPTAVVTRGDVTSTISVSGNLEAPDNRTIAFTMPGTVEAVLVEKGDAVTRGAVLARLDARDLERNVELARTQLEQARTQYNIADQQLRATIYPNYYGSYVVDVPGLWTALDNASDRVDQVRDLIAKGDVAESNAVLDRMLEDIEVAKERSQARNWDLPAQVKAMEYQRDLAALAITAAELNLQGVREMLDDATVIASTSGVVSMVNVKQGDVLTQATFAAPAFQVVDPSHLEMTGLIDEMDVAGINLGQEVVVTLDALPAVEVPGTVTFIADAALIQAGVVLYPTTITLQNPDPRVKDGMSATADIIVEKHPDVLTVPSSAVFSDSGRSIVYLVGADGESAVQEVTTGLRSGRLIEIVSGLQEGDTVALEEPEE
ncbi:MAG: efflux RND transporter periplasmic adaptor subunit [Dehalococcoidia bacterium]|nr:efflux RND transporter periplasmic adaptor subunit [Dehalococcoidia bacterium]